VGEHEFSKLPVEVSRASPCNDTSLDSDWIDEAESYADAAQTVADRSGELSPQSTSNLASAVFSLIRGIIAEATFCLQDNFCNVSLLRKQRRVRTLTAVDACPLVLRFSEFGSGQKAAGVALLRLHCHDTYVNHTVQIGLPPKQPAAMCSAGLPRRRVFWLQGVTMTWMLVELGVAVYAAFSARSPAMLAFGSDSLVELLSALVVLSQWIPGVSVSERRAAEIAAMLLFALAFVVTAASITSLALGARPEVSRAGISIALAALLAMPALAWLKRREARLSGNLALAADAAQSTTCAYLALTALAGVGVNAVFHLAWFDAAAALVAVPLLLKEGRSARRGRTCACC